MSRSICSKTAMVLVIASAFLISPLITAVWAKADRSQGASERSGNNSRSERVDRAPSRSDNRPSAPANENTSRAARPSRARDSSSAPSAPQTPAQQPSNPSPSFRPSSNSQPSGIDNSRNVFQRSRAPVEVRVEQPTPARRIEGPTVITTNQGTRPDSIQTPAESRRRPVIRENNPKDNVTISPDRTARIASTIETPRTDSTPNIRERRDNPIGERITRTRDNSGNTNSRENSGLFDRIRGSRSRDTEQSTVNHDGKGGSGRTEFVRSNRSDNIIGRGDHDSVRIQPVATSRIRYEDRNYIARGFRYEHAFRDRHQRLITRIISPDYCYPVYYHWGHNHHFNYVYPFYNRRFVFVSLGGFWPDYSCIRYYWYPSHFYEWYGYYPVAYETGGDTTNYYTYNYYGTQDATTATDYSTGAADITPVDDTTFADVRAKLAKQQQQTPDAKTDADTLFDEGVKAFGNGQYAEAEEKFARAMALAPQDIILPFAYGQALLAQGKYTQAAEILRIVIEKSTPDKEGVYFPRGLYLDENTLMDQIDTLAKQAEANPNDCDLQLLLGYHWLGIGESEKALGPLNNAKADSRNAAATTILIDLAEKIKSGETQ